MDNITFVGLDVHKATVCAAVAESGRNGEVRQIGVFENRPDVLTKMVTRLGKVVGDLAFFIKKVAVVIVWDDCCGLLDMSALWLRRL